MGLFDALDVSASGLTAERLRMDVAAENLANAQSTGADGRAYRRKEVVVRPQGQAFSAVLASVTGGGGRPSQARGVEVTEIRESEGPLRRVHDPGHPDADADGYVSLPDVQPVNEMVDLISASRAYEANVTAMQTAKQMFTKTLDILR
jgi:flagellar basal-body rod protein FlgC